MHMVIVGSEQCRGACLPVPIQYGAAVTQRIVEVRGVHSRPRSSPLGFPVKLIPTFAVPHQDGELVGSALRTGWLPPQLNGISSGRLRVSVQ